MFVAKDEEIIVAQCTPSGSGAIALIRVCGENVRNLIDKCSKLQSGKKISSVVTHTVNYGYLIQKDGSSIDQVLFMVMDGPKTFTGQDTIEITCHNNPFIIEKIINEIISLGGRIAHEGEFSKRAFLNGKIDLIQAEAINELINANTQLALKKSLSQLEGSFTHWASEIEYELLRTLAWSDASFEFIEEENIEFGEQIKKSLETLLTKIKSIQKTFDSQQQIRQGIKIALVGTVNAGKSSIFNSILNQNRSIVTNIAGTTRDVIEAGIYRNGNYWTLSDTAGFRQTNDIIEKEGIKRSFEEAKKADIVLLIYDGSKLLSPEEQIIYKELLELHNNKIILVKNKIDISQIDDQLSEHTYYFSFSNKIPELISNLEKAIQDKIDVVFSNLDSPYLINKRQHKLLEQLNSKLNLLIPMLEGKIAYELISYHLKDCLETLSEFTGKTISEEGMDMVFKEFCVGK